jgi:hypothetical protein
MLNQVLEAALAFMILLLLLSVTAIVRIDTAVPATTETNANGEPAAAQNGRPTGVPTNALWAGSLAPPPAPARKSAVFGRGRYHARARHVRGRMPKTRPPSPAGPPWGPAAPPPGLPRQGSERFI